MLHQSHINSTNEIEKDRAVDYHCEKSLKCKIIASIARNQILAHTELDISQRPILEWQEKHVSTQARQTNNIVNQAH